jgi:hypothetical protein
MRILAGVLAIVSFAGVARAQAIPGSPAPPLALVIPPPEPGYLPPRYLPELRNDWAEVARQARAEKIAGATLFSVGGSVAAVGLGMLIGGLWQANGSGLCGKSGCVVDNVAQVGAIDLAIGTAAVLAGVPVYAVGAAQARRALRLRYQWSAAPNGARLSF